MTDLPIAQTLHRKAAHDGDPVCRLDYAARFLRRKRLTTEDGRAFIVDLAQTTSLDDGDVLELTDGSRVAIRAAEEAVLEIRGENLPRLAWHIGNRHTPCQIEADHLKIQNDPVIAHMLEHLDAEIAEATAPFTPEGGAYGHGRTHSHEHGATAHSHSQSHSHSHSHSHTETHVHPHDHADAAHEH
ncbi:Urease accessory protein UreE 1 [Roseivivax sp. THAF40]|uniref:urease accessory protein UreE n=1 Tax=unclassified Roseivivax TaxID=2639302 RepID=UPI001268A827|nr:MULTISPECIES: urease accessory protein UreE [unclassified Roseivivax]QFS83649.1 Urease accessory protein UreE 1 [Roseivivax sp. THAF197b]QFT47457.1 Urease accessory protein UreE 1 [Roseivivax sp. THAF40]